MLRGTSPSKSSLSSNTHYRVRFDGDIPDGSATSDAVELYVLARPDVDLFSTSRPFKIAGVLNLDYSSKVDPEYFVDNRVIWYFRKKSQPVFKRIEETRFQDSPDGVQTSVKIDLPKSRKGYRYFIVACTNVPAEDIGTGEPEAFICPRRLAVRPKASAPVARAATP